MGITEPPEKVGILTTIPGPGFAYTIPAIAEAAQDSVALLYVAGKPLARGKAFDLQAMDQTAILGPLVKRIFEIDNIADLAAAVEAAHHATTAGEAGPVLLQVAEHS